MPATFMDYAIAIGVLLLGFAAVIGYVTGFSTNVQSDIKISTLQSQALSLLGLSDREFAFNDSVSGFGLAASFIDTSAHPPKKENVIGAAALQHLATSNYSTIRENFEFRIRVLDDSNAVTFSYGPIPPLSNVVALKKPVQYESGGMIKSGTLTVDVW